MKENLLRIGLLVLVVFCLPGWHSVRAAEQRMNMIVTAAYVSERGMDVYKELGEYLGKKTGYKTSLVSGTSYEVADLLLKKGHIQVGFVCGLPYTENVEKGIYRLLAMPTMKNQTGNHPDARGYGGIPGKYYSYTIVQKDSAITSWSELEGKSYTYSDKKSNSGYNMPRYKLLQMGYSSWNDYFSRIVVSGSHEESIKLVANGSVTASSVDSLVLDYDRSIGDKNALNVRIIEHLFDGGAGIPPVVISNQAPKGMLEKLQKALLTMHHDPVGRIILDKALIEKFLPPDDRNYDEVRKYKKEAQKRRFVDHDEE